MRIDRGQIIAGFPAIKVRYAIKNLALRGSGGTVEYLADMLGCSKAKGKEFVAEMVLQGYLIHDTRFSRDKRRKYYRTTLKGNRLANAKAIPPIKRVTAEKKVREIVARAEEINSFDYAYKVKSLVVFGSYLSDRDTINDIDLAIELIEAHDDREAQKRAESRSVDRSTRFLWSYRDEIYWPETEVLQVLKQRSPMYSFHEPEEVKNFIRDNKDFKYKVIYNLEKDSKGLVLSKEGEC